MVVDCFSVDMRAFGIVEYMGAGPGAGITGESLFEVVDDGAFADLKSFESPVIHVDRFTPEFLTFLDAADLSVSMAGYNTSMNIMAAGTPALVWPFAQNGEQRLRAERLARLGGMQILSDRDLDPERLAGLMTRMLKEKARSAGAIDLDGAEKTAAWITEIQGRRV